MTIYDYGTIKAFATGEAVDIHFPYDARFVEVLKKKDGVCARWDQTRRCWRATPGGAGVSSIAEVAEKLENLLLSIAPDTWRRTLPSLKTLACVHPRFEVVAGAGGLRLRVPIGHLCERHIKKIEGARLHEGAWYLNPQAIIGSGEAVKKILAAIMGEDRRMFLDHVGFMEQRIIAGPVSITESDLRAYRNDDGTVFVDMSFIRKADANMAKIDTPIYPMKLVQCKSSAEGELFAVFSYSLPERAYELLQGRAAERKVGGILNEDAVKAAWCRMRPGETLVD